MFAWRSVAFENWTRRVGLKTFVLFRKIDEDLGGSASWNTQNNCRVSYKRATALLSPFFLFFSRDICAQRCVTCDETRCKETNTTRKERDDTNLLWPHPFTEWGPWSVIRAAHGSISSRRKGRHKFALASFSISSRTDDKDESERSLSSSYLPFSLLGGYGVDLPLRKSRCSCFLVTHEHTDCQQGPGAAVPRGGNFDLLDGGRGSRGELWKLHADGPSINHKSPGDLIRPHTSVHSPSIAPGSTTVWGHVALVNLCRPKFLQ